jgi:hypothetical protein
MLEEIIVPEEKIPAEVLALQLGLSWQALYAGGMNLRHEQ